MTEQTRDSRASGRTTERIGAVYGGNRFSVLRTHLAACVESCEYYQATALYNEVSGISDAELHRRGLSLPRSASVRPKISAQKLRLPTSAQFAREATPVLTPLS